MKFAALYMRVAVETHCPGLANLVWRMGFSAKFGYKLTSLLLQEYSGVSEARTFVVCCWFYSDVRPFGFLSVANELQAETLFGKEIIHEILAGIK